MDNVKNDNYFVGKIKEDLAFIVKHTKDIEIEEALEVEEITVTKIVDQPKAPIIVLLISLITMMIIGLVMKV